MEGRLAEIFEFVNNELKLISRAGRLPVGIVLVGGGAKLPGIIDFVKEELKLPAQIGIPEMPNLEVPSGEISLQTEDPEFVCSLGLLLWGRDRLYGEAVEGKARVTGWFRKIFNELLP